MTHFAYKAKRGPAQIVEGHVEAETLARAVSKIQQLGFVPIDVVPQPMGGAGVAIPKAVRTILPLSVRIPRSEIMLFTRQIADLCDAGVPVLRGLSLVQRQTRHPQLKTMVGKMSEIVRDGGMLSQAMAQFPSAFPRIYVNMVRAGEVGGNLDVVLNRLANHAEQDQEVMDKIRAGLVYPAFILGAGVLTMVVLFTWVIPRLIPVFEDLSDSLPLPTLILIAISNFIQSFWWLILGVLVAVVAAVKSWVGSRQGREQFDRYKIRLPLAGGFIKDAETGRFARTLGTLLDNGVTIVTALESVWPVLNNEVVRQEVKDISQKVSDGASLNSALKESPFFPDAVVSMVAVGEESGQIQKGLFKIADYYERRTQNTMKRITSLIEPVLIFIIALIVGFVVIAMLLPVFRMNLSLQ